VYDFLSGGSGAPSLNSSTELAENSATTN